jgi:hypothetical protein
MSSQPEFFTKQSSLQNHITGLTDDIKQMQRTLMSLNRKIAFTAPEITDPLLVKIKNFDYAIKAQQRRIETLEKIANKDTVSQDDIDHLTKIAALSEYKTYENIQVSSELNLK